MHRWNASLLVICVSLLISLIFSLQTLWKVQQALWKVQQALWKIQQALWKVLQALWKVQQALWKVLQTLWKVPHAFCAAAPENVSPDIHQGIWDLPTPALKKIKHETFPIYKWKIDIIFVMQKYNISDCLLDMYLQRLTIISIMFLLQFSQRPANNLLHQCLKLVSASSKLRSTTLLYNSVLFIVMGHYHTWQFCSTLHCFLPRTVACITVFVQWLHVLPDTREKASLDCWGWHLSPFSEDSSSFVMSEAVWNTYTMKCIILLCSQVIWSG